MPIIKENQENRFHPGWLAREDNRRHTEPEYLPGESRPRRGPSEREASRENTLRDFVGAERAAAIISDLRPEPQKIAELVNEQLRQFCPPALVVLNRIRRDWATIFPDCAAKVTYPSHIDNGKLIIEVSNQSWLYVLQRQDLSQTEKRLAEISDNLITGITLRSKGRFRR